MFAPRCRDCSSCWYDSLMVPLPQVVGEHWVGNVPRFFVDYVLDFDFLGIPFGCDDADDAEVMVGGG